MSLKPVKDSCKSPAARLNLRLYQLQHQPIFSLTTLKNMFDVLAP
jgi:hypothetical protein